MADFGFIAGALFVVVFLALAFGQVQDYCNRLIRRMHDPRLWIRSKPPWE